MEKIILEIPQNDSFMQILSGVEGINIKTIETLLDLEVTYNSLTITWTGISTPKGLDTNYLTEYFLALPNFH